MGSKRKRSASPRGGGRRPKGKAASKAKVSPKRKRSTSSRAKSPVSAKRTTKRAPHARATINFKKVAKGFEFSDLTTEDFEIGTETKKDKLIVKLAHADKPITAVDFNVPSDWVECKLKHDRPPKFTKIVKNMCNYQLYPFLRQPRRRKDEAFSKCNCYITDKKEFAEEQAERSDDDDDDDEKETNKNENDNKEKESEEGGSSRRRGSASVGKNGAGGGGGGGGEGGEETDKQEDDSKEMDQKGCLRNCINHVLQVECNAANCSYPDGKGCRNRFFTRREHARCEPKRAGMKGWGLRLLQDVTAGQFLAEYVGEVIPASVCENRLKKEYQLYQKNKKHKISHYFLTLNDAMIIDARSHGGNARFINHSCSPNCEIQHWELNGEIRAGIFSKSSMKADSEITIDYRYEYLDNEQLKSQPCFCGSDNCCKYIGAKKRKVETPKKAAGKTKGKKKKPSRKTLLEEHRIFSDSLCSICGEEGELMMCDGSVDRQPCPRCFHARCLRMKEVPNFRWLCPYHFCDECGKPPQVYCRYCSDSWCRACEPKGLKQLDIPTHGKLTKFVCCPECEKEPLNPERTAEEIEELRIEARELAAKEKIEKEKAKQKRAKLAAKEAKDAPRGAKRRGRTTTSTPSKASKKKTPQKAPKPMQDLITASDAKYLLRDFRSVGKRMNGTLQIKLLQLVHGKSALPSKVSAQLSQELNLGEIHIQEWFTQAKILWS